MNARRSVGFVAVSSRTEENAKLERHVKTRQVVYRIELGSGDVVNAITTMLDDPVKLINACITAVLYLEGAARPKSAVVYSKEESVKEGHKVRIERAVEEDVVAHVHRHFNGFLNAPMRRTS